MSKALNNCAYVLLVESSGNCIAVAPRANCLQPFWLMHGIQHLDVISVGASLAELHTICFKMSILVSMCLLWPAKASSQPVHCSILLQADPGADCVPRVGSELDSEDGVFVADDEASYTKEETKTQRFASVVHAAGKGSAASLASSRSYDDFQADFEPGAPPSWQGIFVTVHSPAPSRPELGRSFLELPS